MAQGLFERIAENPFYVLGVAVTASRTDTEREGSKLLTMLQLDLKESRSYRSPVGDHPRTAVAVRAAMAELRDPKRRLVHELLASLPVSVAVPSSGSKKNELKWGRAPMVFGYGPERED